MTGAAARKVAAVLVAAASVVAIPASRVAAASGDAKDPHHRVPKRAARADKGPAPKGSAWQHVLGEIGADGQVTKKTALQAFALVLGPLPGTHVPKGAHASVHDGGAAVRAVLGHWAELSPAQQAAVRKALAGRPITAAGGQGQAFPRKAPDALTVVTEMLARYDAPLGHLPIPVHVSYLGYVPKGDPAETEAIAWPVDATGGHTGVAAACDVEVTPIGAAATASDFEMIVAHELFHCYQGVWLGLDRYYAPGSSWAMEGAATWAGYNVAPAPPSDDNNWWFTYVATAAKPLFAREHDAVGFFGQVAQWGVDLWSLFPQFFQTSGDVARYQMLADATGDKLLDAWGPGYWLSKDLGPKWRIEGKAVPPAGSYYSKPGSIAVGNGASVSVQSVPYAVALYSGAPTADVTEVQIDGHARLADQGGFDSGDLTDTLLCTKSGGSCTCPSDNDNTNGGNGLPASIQKVDGTLLLGLTGATAGTKGTVTGMSLDQWCKSRNKKKATTTCQLLDVPTIDKITGLHITQVKQTDDACVYGDPSAPVNNVLEEFGAAITKGFTGTSVTPGSGAGLIARLQSLPPGAEPKVSDYFDQIPAGLCDTPQLIDGVNGASVLCGGVLNVAVIGDGRYTIMTYLGPGDGGTHEQGAALGRAAAERL